MGQIKDRLLILVNELTDGKPAVFAKKVGIPHSTFHNYIKGRKPHSDHLIRIRDTFRVNIDWLLTGKGNKYFVNQIKDPDSEYDQHGGWEPRDLHDFAGVKKGLGYAQAVSLLADIFRTEDQDLINSTISLLRESTESLPQSKIISIDPGQRMAEMFINKSGIQLDEKEEKKLAAFFKKRLEKKIAEIEGQIIEETEDELIDLLKVAKGGSP